MPTTFNFHSPPSSPKYGYFSNPKHSNRGGSPRRLHRHVRVIAIIAFIVLSLIYYVHDHHAPPQHAPSLRFKSVDWSRFAYSQYATDSHYLCNSVMVFEALERLGSKADRILMYPEDWDTEIAHSKDRDSQLLVMARDKYRAKLIPVVPLKISRDQDWREGTDYSERS